MIRMATFAEALALIEALGRERVTAAEVVRLADAPGRRLAEPVRAQVDQPPAAVSAMDGYAVRREDAVAGAGLAVISESRAGAPSLASLRPGAAIAIFTGAIVPAGADFVLIQENARRGGDQIEVLVPASGADSIRPRGLDFRSGDLLVPAGEIVTAGALALIAAGNNDAVSVRVRPRIALLANGDELAQAGSRLREGQVVNSISPALVALINQWGGTVEDLGAAADNPADVRRRLSATDAGLVVSIGGASVGDHDVVRSAFAAASFEPVFEKVAMKPGKPTWLSAHDERLALGLPGNPAAAMVTAHLFLRPLIFAMLGASLRETGASSQAVLEHPLPAAGAREEFLRATLTLGSDGIVRARAAERQDSSLLHPFLRADILLRRPAQAEPASAGDLVPYIPLG